MLFSKLERIAEQVERLTWKPSSGHGSGGGLKVSLASNFKSASIDFSRTCKYMAQIPQSVFLPASKQAYSLAVKYSSGPGKPKGYYSLKKRRRERDYIINIQTGLMVKSWRRRPARITGNDLKIGLYNTARSKKGFNYPLALFTGTIKMRDRPLPQKVDEDIAREIDLAIKRESMRILRAWKRGKGTVE